MYASTYDPELHWRFSQYVDFGYFFDCWNWTGATVKARRSTTYRWGVINARGKTMKASRLSWTLNRGEIPEGSLVLHTCDNPMCVNPGHLYLGTTLDNIQDMDRKGRRTNAPLNGVRHPNAKLTGEQVGIIRQHIGSATPLARLFGVTPEQINNIRRGAQRKEG